MQDAIDRQTVCDVLVVGTGAAGFAAAITARKHGLDVLMVEKAGVIGGTTAFSGGGLWVPNNPLAHAASVDVDPAQARRYLESEAGNALDGAVVDAFLEHGPTMVAFFHESTEVRFVSSPHFPDYHPDAPGAGVGRTLLTEAYDGRQLGRDISRLRRPLPQMTMLGMTLASGEELWHFLRATRSLRSAAYVGRLFARYAADLLVHGRGMRLTNGNALAARLFKTALDLGIPIWTDSPATDMNTEGRRVSGAVVTRKGAPVRVDARAGVVLATGGFPQSPEFRARLFAHAPHGQCHFSPAPAGNVGDGIRMGIGAGGEVRPGMTQPAAWVPVSLIPERGASAVFPHLIDRQKPGIIAVNASGRRFVNEAGSYHDFVPPMIEAAGGGEPFAYLICDHRAQRRYGLGYAKPFPVPLRHYLRSGYLRRAETIEALAGKIGVPAGALAETVRRHNLHAVEGRDPDFGRGESAYNRFMGDPTNEPNPCLAPLERPPFYAVRVVPGDLGTFAGLRTDAAARVLDRESVPIPGLYAVGNDMANPFGGAYPGAGSTLGPGMTFGYVAGLDLARRRSSGSS